MALHARQGTVFFLKDQERPPVVSNARRKLVQRKWLKNTNKQTEIN